MPERRDPDLVAGPQEPCRRDADGGERLLRSAQLVLPRRVDRGDDTQHGARLRQAEHGGGVAQESGIAATALDEPVEDGVPAAQVVALQAQLLQPVGLHERRRAAVVHPPHVARRVQQRLVVPAGEPSPGRLQQRVPQHPPAQAVGAQHDLEGHALTGAAPAGVARGVLRVDATRHLVGDHLDAALQVGPARRAQLVDHVPLGVDRFALQHQHGEAVGEPVDVVQQRGPERPQRLVGGRSQPATRAPGGQHLGTVQQGAQRRPERRAHCPVPRTRYWALCPWCRLGAAPKV